MLAALAVSGGCFALLGWAAAVWGGGSLVTNLLGLGGAVLGGASFVALVGTGLSPGEDEDMARALRTVKWLAPLGASLSMLLLIALA